MVKSHHFIGLLLISSLALLSLGCGLAELLQPRTTMQLPTATATQATATAEATATLTPEPSATATATPAPPTTTSTPEPTMQASNTPSPEPPAPTDTVAPPAPTDTQAPSPTEVPQLRVDSFDVQLQDTASGKLIRCAWETSGATKVQIVVGTSQRFPPWQEGPPDGETDFEVMMTYYDEPDVTLTAYGEGSAQVSTTVNLPWSCEYTYFFAGSVAEVPRICPSDRWQTRQGAQQPFLGGTMIWIPDIEGRDQIFTIYNDQTWNVYEDTWTEGQPESDPGIVPPSDLYQPIRGFGKVWRENPEVQNKLDWATAGEKAVVVTYQRQMQESIGGVRYIEVTGGSVLRLIGLGGSGSTWSTVQ